MTRPYKLCPSSPIGPNHPLHWTRFWPNLQRVHRSRAEARQDLVLWLANLYQSALKAGPLGFSSIKVRLMDFREMVRDYQPALDFFFEVQQRGFFIDDENTEISTLIPKRLNPELIRAFSDCTDKLEYAPPDLPADAIISKVYLEPTANFSNIKERLIQHGRAELIPALKWLFKNGPEFNFHFMPSGKLKLRDTSVWPISGIETWPSWVREELFGPGIDLDSAYVQFLLVTLKKMNGNRQDAVASRFPDLVRLLDDKENIRREICENILKREYNQTYRSVVKRIIMSLANGSKISPNLLTSGSGFSQTAAIILEAAPDLSASELIEAGSRLQSIAHQFSSAKKAVCLYGGRAATRQNVRAVFTDYFAWEREARYAIWNAVGQHGLMVHDGLDGIPRKYIDQIPEIVKALNLRLTC